MAVLFLFIDGIGIGAASNMNPFSVFDLPGFKALAGGERMISSTQPVVKNNQVYKPIDANLGVEGLPQSGTGQTALFTGVNAAQHIGKHFGPYPHTEIKQFLIEHSLFNEVVRIGKKPYFMNAYPPVFFEYSEKRNRWSCSTLMVRSALNQLNSTGEILKEKALTAEIIQDAWRERLDIDIPPISPEIAALRLLEMAVNFDVVMYEYYLTDKAGHQKSMEDALTALSVLDTFLLTMVEHLAPGDTIVLSSDHGNLEDCGVKTHTRNPVPLMVYGNGAEAFADIDSIMGVKKGIIDAIR
ncbi:MAG: hypothetical protein AAFW89_01880 [Bacteroidota bacterium]